MAAYTALVSLTNLMEQMQNHPRHSFSFDHKQIEFLRQNVDFLLDFIQSYDSLGVSKEAEDLERRIASTAHEAEDVIETHIVDQIHAGFTFNRETGFHFLVDLQNVIEEMDSMKRMAMELKVQRGFRDQLPVYPKPSSSSRPLTTGKNAMVGFDDELIQLMERLTAPLKNRKTIQIVGMGGIGKTTLARNVYEHLLIVQSFDVRLWTTISQQFSVKEILLQLLHRQGKSTSESVHELGEQLYKSLSGRRYLIILDDMWSLEAWDKIKLFFPDNGNRSRIVITTRISNMGVGFGSSSFVMNFLDKDRSWKLFCEKAFGEEACPPELEEIGEKIVKCCKGLPLSIVVLGGHLRKSLRTKEYWENVGNDINSILNSGDDGQCLNILSLSYSHLPVYLKPCFLYMGLYQEDNEIFVQELIRFWVAEGFLKPNKAQSLEETAEGYVKDLVERNLIQVRTCNWNGKIKTCSIHDLLRDLCLKVAEKEKFFCVLNIPRALHGERCVVIHERIPHVKHHPEVFHALKSACSLRSLRCQGGELLFDVRLLRVLDWVHVLMQDVHECSLGTHFRKVNLRHLNVNLCNYVFPDPLSYPSLYLPSSISLLWNLQTLIIRGDCEVIAPYEIWEMPQLRHLVIIPIYLPDPLPSDRSDQLVLRNLQTFVGVTNLKLSEDVCKRIPNIRELHMLYVDFPSGCESNIYYCPHNLGRLQKLESLHLDFSKEPYWRDFVRNITFPSSLQELSLRNCFLHWKDLTIIGSLPHLEVLVLLGDNSILGPEWNPIEGEFFRLKSLEIYSCDDLICWNADNSHFPALENLVLGGMSKLDEIPLGIGEILTLRNIKLYSCSISAAISAMRILMEQESFGNESLQLHVEFSDKKEEESFMEMVKLEGLASNNLHLKPCYGNQEIDPGIIHRYADAVLAATQSDA